MGGLRFRSEWHVLEYCRQELCDGEQIQVQGRISSKEYKNDQYIYYLSSSLFGKNLKERDITLAECKRVMVCSDTDACSVGEIIVVKGTTKLWKTAVNEGGFDEKSYYESRQIYFQVENAVIESVHGKKNRFAEWLYALKIKLAMVYENSMDPQNSGIMITMLLGDKSGLKREVKELYRSAGILHALTISGLHLSIIGMSLYRLMRKRKAGFIMAGIVSGVLVCSYAQMAGMGVSAKRAVGMFLLSVLAQALALKDAGSHFVQATTPWLVAALQRAFVILAPP